MLKQRIITALLLLPVVIWVVLGSSHTLFAVVLSGVLLLGAWEWSRIAGIHQTTARLSYCLFTALVIASVSWLLHIDTELLLPILLSSGAWWLISFVWVLHFNRSPMSPAASVGIQKIDMSAALVGIVILAGTFIGLIGLHDNYAQGPEMVLILLFLIWIADSAAYFTGRKYGKHKLAIHVSPGKSWEGVAGAVIAICIAVLTVSFILKLNFQQQLSFLVICLTTVGFSILGDLTESMFKRRAGIKDSGQLLPGHGGIMDRIDSLTAAAPIFLLGLMLTGLP